MSFLTLCVLTPLRGQSQSVKFFEGTLYEAIDAARSQRKILLAEFYASWNHKSRWMHEVLANSKELGDNFMFYSIDTETKEGAGLAVQYSLTNYPLIVVFSTNGNAIAKIDKPLEEADLKAQLLTLTLNNDRFMLQRLNQIYTIASSPDLATPAQLDSLVNYYLNIQTQEYLTMPQHWELFSSGSITYYGSSSYKYLLNHYLVFHDSEQAKERIKQICYDAVMPYVIGNSELKESELLFDIMLADSSTLEVVPMLEDLILLVRLRVEGSESLLIEKIEYAANRMPENYEYQLIMSVDFIVDRLDRISKADKTKARKILESLREKVSSSAKIQLIDSLLSKFS